MPGCTITFSSITIATQNKKTKRLKFLNYEVTLVTWGANKHFPLVLWWKCSNASSVKEVEWITSHPVPLWFLLHKLPIACQYLAVKLANMDYDVEISHSCFLFSPCIFYRDLLNPSASLGKCRYPPGARNYNDTSASEYVSKRAAFRVWNNTEMKGKAESILFLLKNVVIRRMSYYICGTPTEDSFARVWRSWASAKLWSRNNADDTLQMSNHHKSHVQKK